MILNLFLLYHCIIFFIFFAIYLNSMLFFPSLWDGIDEKYYFIDSLYFTMCTHSSLGYGDISTKSRIIRFIITIHMICVFLPFIIDYTYNYRNKI